MRVIVSVSVCARLGALVDGRDQVEDGAGRTVCLVRTFVHALVG